MRINLNTLTAFEINQLVMQGYCFGQQITYEPQREFCDILELMDDTCYFTTASGSKQSFNHALSEQISAFISEYKINIAHESDSVTVSSAEQPDIDAVTLVNASHRKAIAFLVILIFDRYKKAYTVEPLQSTDNTTHAETP
jgi:hypothetical protein